MFGRYSLRSSRPAGGIGVAAAAPRLRSRARFVAAVTAALTAAVLLPAAASAASPAAFTTDSTGSAVNKNHYDNKCDVYLNGGPTGASLPTGTYTFAVLSPGGPADPNGPNLLSSDSNAERTFSSSGGTISYSGSHATSTDATTGATLIQLCGYADTSNSGGVYIMAICSTSNMTPSGCKYDAFKVGSNPPGVGTDLTATKTAAGAYTRTFDWDLTKGVVGSSSVNTNSNTATFNYTVTVTKSAGVDSGFVVSGEVQVFNTNDATVTGVSVSDAIGSTTCTVSGGATTIASGGSATFSYTCNLLSAAATTTGTNTATVTWDQASINSPTSSATATAPFNFSAAPQLVNNCTTVTDTITPGTLGQVTLGSPCATTTYNYSRTVAVPATGCLQYTNTAVESATGDSDSKTVTVCRTNSNGFTIGYWQNKNGQNQIKAAAAALCTYLAQFSNVLTPYSPCATKLAQYVYDVVKLANAAGTGAPMFRAQFLATALNVRFAPSLGMTGVVVPTTIDLDGCATVNELLAYGNANYATLSTADKTFFMTVKSLYDAINNNQAITC